MVTFIFGDNLEETRVCEYCRIKNIDLIYDQLCNFIRQLNLLDFLKILLNSISFIKFDFIIFGLFHIDVWLVLSYQTSVIMQVGHIVNVQSQKS